MLVEGKEKKGWKSHTSGCLSAAAAAAREGINGGTRYAVCMRNRTGRRK